MAGAFLSSLVSLLLCICGTQGTPNGQSTVDDAEVDRLIQKLPSEKAQGWVMIFAVCDVFSVPNDDSDSPAHKLAALRYKAVPKLIAAISDARATKCALSLTVGDVALQILEEIAGRQFTSWHAPMRVSEIPEKIRDVSAWWAEAQKIGELAALTKELNSPRNQQAAVAIEERFPTESTRILRSALQSKNPGLMREQCDHALAISHDPAAKAVLREEAESGPDAQSRVSAAREFCRSNPKYAAAIYVKEWKRFLDPPATRSPRTEPEWPFTRKAFIDPMLRCGDLTALKCLAENLPSRSPEFRSSLVESTIVVCSNSLDRTYASTVERMLAGELDDGGLGPTNIGIGDESFSSPEIGDLAAFAISQTSPKRYHYKRPQFRGQMVAQRAVFKNIWRASVGLSPLPIKPLTPKAKPRSADTIVAVVVRNEGQSTSKFANWARGMKGQRLSWERLTKLYGDAAKITVPPDRGVRVLFSRDMPGEGLTLTIDFSVDGLPGGYCGAMCRWCGIWDGKCVLWTYGGFSVEDLDRLRGRAGKCIHSATSEAVTIDFRVWPSA